MDKQTRCDLIILAGSLAGVALAAAIKSPRRTPPEPLDDHKVAFLAIPSFIATVTITRRSGALAQFVPDRPAVAGLAAIAVGTGIGLVSNVLGGFLPGTK